MDINSGMEDIFTPDNTHWEYEDGHSTLVYEGSFDELSEETGIEVDTLRTKLKNYEDESRELQSDLDEIEKARRGDY